MLDGLPSLALHGPLLPLSSQFMLPPASFQMLKASTMPPPSAWPMPASPPTDAAEEQADAKMLSPPRAAPGMVLPLSLS